MENGKGYNLKTEFRGDHLWALVGGEKLTAEIAAAYWNEIADECIEMSCEKILIEKDFKVTVGPDQLIQMAEHLGKVLPMSRVAFVDHWHHDSINELGKRLARNREVKMQVFADAGDAEKWLRAN